MTPIAPLTSMRVDLGHPLLAVSRHADALRNRKRAFVAGLRYP
ncbi:MAG: hypothetical protein WBC44_14385 [Planctomycetaceae bacterium]